MSLGFNAHCDAAGDFCRAFVPLSGRGSCGIDASAATPDARAMPDKHRPPMALFKEDRPDAEQTASARCHHRGLFRTRCLRRVRARCASPFPPAFPRMACRRLLTGLSLVRIRPGEPNQIKDLSENYRSSFTSKNRFDNAYDNIMRNSRAAEKGRLGGAPACQRIPASFAGTAQSGPVSPLEC
jgi:hypothetical protein